MESITGNYVDDFLLLETEIDNDPLLTFPDEWEILIDDTPIEVKTVGHTEGSNSLCTTSSEVFIPESNLKSKRRKDDLVDHGTKKRPRKTSPRLQELKLKIANMVKFLFSAMNSGDEKTIRDWVAANCSPDIKINLRRVGYAADGNVESTMQGKEAYAQLILKQYEIAPDCIMIMTDIKLRQNKDKTRSLIYNCHYSGTALHKKAAGDGKVDISSESAESTESALSSARKSYVPNMHITGTAIQTLNSDDIITDVEIVSYFNHTPPRN